MTKEITIKIKLETEDVTRAKDVFIKNDLETEINCCSNSYDIEEIMIKDVNS